MSSRTSTSSPPPADVPGLPTYAAYKLLEETHLRNLCTVSRQEKALIPQAFFDRIWQYLADGPANTRPRVSRSSKKDSEVDEEYRNRFWARTHFKLGCPLALAGYPPAHAHTIGLLTLGGLVVAVREHMYQILCWCHLQTGHGGQDEMNGFIGRYYSHVPKRLVHEFVKACPTCAAARALLGLKSSSPKAGRRRASKRSSSASSTPPSDENTSPPPTSVEENDRMEEDRFEILDCPPPLPSLSTPSPDPSSASPSPFFSTPPAVPFDEDKENSRPWDDYILDTLEQLLSSTAAPPPTDDRDTQNNSRGLLDILAHRMEEDGFMILDCPAPPSLSTPSLDPSSASPPPYSSTPPVAPSDEDKENSRPWDDDLLNTLEQLLSGTAATNDQDTQNNSRGLFDILAQLPCNTAPLLPPGSVSPFPTSLPFTTRLPPSLADENTSPLPTSVEENNRMEEDGFDILDCPPPPPPSLSTPSADPSSASPPPSSSTPPAAPYDEDKKNSRPWPWDDDRLDTLEQLLSGTAATDDQDTQHNSRDILAQLSFNTAPLLPPCSVNDDLDLLDTLLYDTPAFVSAPAPTPRTSPPTEDAGEEPRSDDDLALVDTLEQLLSLPSYAGARTGAPRFANDCDFGANFCASPKPDAWWASLDAFASSSFTSTSTSSSTPTSLASTSASDHRPRNDDLDLLDTLLYDTPASASTPTFTPRTPPPTDDAKENDDLALFDTLEQLLSLPSHAGALLLPSSDNCEFGADFVPTGASPASAPDPWWASLDAFASSSTSTSTSTSSSSSSSLSSSFSSPPSSSLQSYPSDIGIAPGTDTDTDMDMADIFEFASAPDAWWASLDGFASSASTATSTSSSSSFSSSSLSYLAAGTDMDTDTDIANIVKFPSSSSLLPHSSDVGIAAWPINDIDIDVASIFEFASTCTLLPPDADTSVSRCASPRVHPYAYARERCR